MDNFLCGFFYCYKEKIMALYSAYINKELKFSYLCVVVWLSSDFETIIIIAFVVKTSSRKRGIIR